MSRAVKASIDAVLKRIEQESEAWVEVELKRLAKEIESKNLELVSECIAARRKAGTLDALLADRGLEIACGDDCQRYLTLDKRDGVVTRARLIRRWFKEMRDNVIIRLALADDEEKAFMLRYFFDETVKEFPSLKAIVGKLTATEPRTKAQNRPQ